MVNTVSMFCWQVAEQDWFAVSSQAKNATFGELCHQVYDASVQKRQCNIAMPGACCFLYTSGALVCIWDLSVVLHTACQA
eukprot:6206246-Pleurochrysis_carterae.AAC.1